MASTPPVLDIYAGLGHKQVVETGFNGWAPSWVPDEDRRRLGFYKLLKAYELNRASAHLPDSTPEDVRSAMREFGDAALFASAVRAGVVGAGPDVVVEGAATDVPDEPHLPPLPEPVPEGYDGPDLAVRERVYESQLARWNEAAERAVEDWERLAADVPLLQERERWLRDWAETEGLWGKVHEAEGDAVTLGDGVYTLAWSARKRRPVLRVWDPGFYFPVWDERAADEGFPRKVHLAWQFKRKVPEGTRTVEKEYVRRLTWELVDTDPYPVPWSDDPATEVCVFSDGTWDISDVRGDMGLANLAESAATWAENEDGVAALRLPLGIDFLPVVHVPNTPASREHFGASVLLSVAQLLDDIHKADSDLRDAASLSAGPVLALSGYSGATDSSPVKVKPGVMHRIPEGGRLDSLDVTQSLAPLRDICDSLRDLLSVNGRVPGAALGRIDPGQAPSGVALALLFSPFGQLVGELRLSRDAKYGLLLRMSQRLSQVGGILEPGPTPAAGVAWGPFLPTDRAAVVEQTARLLGAKAISTQTAVASLIAAGWTVEDAEHEVDRIRADDAEGARAVADATGSEALAAERLGLELPEQPVAAAPQISLPGADTATEG